jgi:hypothetical protein
MKAAEQGSPLCISLTYGGASGERGVSFNYARSVLDHI